MKLGVNLWVWSSPFNTNRDLPLLEKVRTFGGEVVEFGLEDDSVVDTRALRSALGDNGLSCSIIGLFNPHRDLASPDVESRQRGIEYAQRGVDISAEVGASIFSGSVAGVAGEKRLSTTEWQSSIQRAAEELDLLGRHAAKIGVRLGIEVLNRYENNLINTAGQARELVNLIQCPSVGIHLDCFHMNIEEQNIGEAICTAGAKLFHLHGSDSHRGIPGRGHVSWSEVSNSLKRIGYDGYVIIESFNPEGRLAPLARVWRPLSDSLDALAQEGLAFLKGHLRNSNAQLGA
jgi:D-psicose/D-tagatose/L-ribulose 3-epimerase